MNDNGRSADGRFQKGNYEGREVEARDLQKGTFEERLAAFKERNGARREANREERLPRMDGGGVVGNPER